MDPVSALILTIGGKYLGVGKLVTAIKLIIAGKKVAGVAIAAKGALIEEAIVHSYKEIMHGNVIINQDPSIISLPDISFTASDLSHDNFFIANSFFEGQSYSPKLSYPQINSDHFNDLILDSNDFASDTTYEALQERIHELYGQDVNIRSIVRQVGNDFTPIYLTNDLPEAYNSIDIQNINNIKFPKETLEWIEQSEFDDSQYDYNDELNNLEPSTSDLNDSFIIQGQAEKSTTQDFYRFNTVNDILNNNEISILQKEDIIIKKLTIHYQLLTEDNEYMVSLSMTEKDVCNHFPDFLHEHKFKLEEDKKVIELLGDKNDSKDLVKKIAKTVNEYKSEFKGKPMSEKIYMALSLLSLSGGIPVVIKGGQGSPSNKPIEGIKAEYENPKPKGTVNKNEEKEQSDLVDPLLGVTHSQIRKKIRKGGIEEVLKLFADKLPDDHSLDKSFLLLQTRFKRYQKLFNEGLIQNSEFDSEIQKITLSLLIFVEEYFSDEEW